MIHNVGPRRTVLAYAWGSSRSNLLNFLYQYSYSMEEIRGRN
jgi:hypothetical protein